MDLDLRDLAFFLAVERQGSFGRAAGELLVSQPAVSERIRHLERVVGGALFDRTSRGAVLTPAGTALLPYARRCVALADETLEAARHAEGTPTLVIAVHSTFAQRIVPFVLGTLGALPRRVSVRDAHSDEVRELVLDGVAHVGFALAAPAPRGVLRRSLPHDDVVCLAATDHPIARAPHASPALLKDSLIALNAWGDGAEAFLARLSAAGVADWRVRHCADAATAVALARDHHHIAFVTNSAATLAPGTQSLRTIKMTALSGWTVRLDLLYRRADREDIVVRTLTNALAGA
jgi:DNA-binding transcriptional LysR family regulator